MQNNSDSSVAGQNPQIHAAFQQAEAVGLLHLVAAKPADSWSGSLHFWRDFGARYVKALCQISPEVTADAITLPPPQNETFEHLVLSVPPMPGAEYCTQAVFSRLWQALNAFVHMKMQQDGSDISHFLHRYLPAWQQVGRVCFHLAENKQDSARPFAFLATYASHVAKNAKVQYLPLSHALREYAGSGNKTALVRLLKPIHAAAEVCPWVDSLLKQYDIYHPLRWSAKEAYRLLKSVPELEKSGIVVRLPDWWKKRPHPHVQVSVGSKNQGTLDMNTILDFNASVALHGKKLTQKEIQELLSAEKGLVSLRGQWVEVDSDKLRAALKHWKQVEQEVASGLSFAESMRLLSGAGQAVSPEKTEEFNNDDDVSWAYVDAGDWLRDVLAKLRDPALLPQQQPEALRNVTLRPYQQQGLSWLYFLNQLGLGACLADDMGLGKTVQVIALLLLRKQIGLQQTGCSLLVLPASLLSNWKSELARFAPTLRVVALHPCETSRARLDHIAKHANALADHDLAMTTYSIVWRQDWLRQRPWDMVILDEAQAIKNPAAKQTQNIKALQAKTRIALTGTPIENRVSDLWSLFDFLCPGLLGCAQAFKNFIKALDQQKKGSYEPLRKLVRPYILRRLKTDKRIINDLPDKTEMAVHCGLTTTQTKLYAQAVGELKNILKNQSTKSMQRKGLVLSYLMRFKQICNHPDQALGQGNYLASQSGKF
ncbi:MAG: DEAD/DEAH box helicase, partial [Myxococcota bacterium]